MLPTMGQLKVRKEVLQPGVSRRLPALASIEPSRELGRQRLAFPHYCHWTSRFSKKGRFWLGDKFTPWMAGPVGFEPTVQRKKRGLTEDEGSLHAGNPSEQANPAIERPRKLENSQVGYEKDGSKTYASMNLSFVNPMRVWGTQKRGLAQTSQGQEIQGYRVGSLRPHHSSGRRNRGGNPSSPGP